MSSRSEGGLAGAIGTEHGHPLARLDFKVDTVDRGGAVGIGEGQPRDCQCLHWTGAFIEIRAFIETTRAKIIVAHASSTGAMAGHHRTASDWSRTRPETRR